MIERPFRLALPLATAMLPPLALLGTPAATVLLIAVALAGLPVLASGDRGAPPMPRGAAWLAILALPALGLLSALWAPRMGESAERALKLVALILAGAVVLLAVERAPPARRHMAIAVLAGIGVAAALALTDRFLLFGLLGRLEPGFVPRHGLYSRGATVLILFAWLAVIALIQARRPLWAALLFAALGALVAVKLNSGAAAMVWALTGVVFVVWQAWNGARAPQRRRIFALALAAACLAAPLAALLPMPDATHAGQRMLPGSWEHRIVIWRFAVARIAERPLLGWGLDASRLIPGGRETIAWQMDPDPQDRGDRMSRVQLMPLHPHSLALQVWLELGLVGALALAALAWLLVGGAARAFAEDSALAGAAVALVYSAMIVSNVSYGAWQTWWLSTLWLVAAALRALAAAPRAEAPSSA